METANAQYLSLGIFSWSLVILELQTEELFANYHSQKGENRAI